MTLSIVNPEEWRPIQGYAGLYEVSSLGRIRSQFRMVRGRANGMRPIPGRTLAPSNVQGYLSVTLACHGHKRRFQVARLVASAFVYVRPELRGRDLEVTYADGDRGNCKPGNLRWVPKYSGATRTLLSATARRAAA